MPANKPKIYYILKDSEDKGKLIHVNLTINPNAPRHVDDNNISFNHPEEYIARILKIAFKEGGVKRFNKAATELSRMYADNRQNSDFQKKFGITDDLRKKDARVRAGIVNEWIVENVAKSVEGNERNINIEGNVIPEDKRIRQDRPLDPVDADLEDNRNTLIEAINKATTANKPKETIDALKDELNDVNKKIRDRRPREENVEIIDVAADEQPSFGTVQPQLKKVPQPKLQQAPEPQQPALQQPAAQPALQQAPELQQPALQQPAAQPRLQQQPQGGKGAARPSSTSPSSCTSKKKCGSWTNRNSRTISTRANATTRVSRSTKTTTTSSWGRSRTSRTTCRRTTGRHSRTSRCRTTTTKRRTTSNK